MLKTEGEEAVQGRAGIEAPRPNRGTQERRSQAGCMCGPRGVGRCWSWIWAPSGVPLGPSCTKAQSADHEAAPLMRQSGRATARQPGAVGAAAPG
ncbi:hypothetical protein NDU88_004957 [Pleurodeles waltl]|uniref:Uncharacterized protein n=1 Tax=Pleurodeles waltl TaxID=8319 RepID=A0AAV7W6G1_PLEWA|nr:hypothetical protein NDU88_004957 [Pleurodeles waltl]